MIAHEVVIIGGGLAGLRAALEASKAADTAIVSKVHPLRSHTVAAQGGINAPLANVSDDDVETHIFDTVKGSDYLGDQDAIRTLIEEAPETIYELEHMGAAFSRTEEGKIAQRPLGGHQNPRTCYAADRTGHILLHTLYEQAVERGLMVYPEYYVVSLIVEDKVCRGLVAYDLRDGRLETFHAKAVLPATGGYGRAFKITTNSHINTGDGLGLVYQEGIPLQDLEFVQFHPTGLRRLGILISESARGEGGHLLNGRGERFMERYAPEKMELAPRDIVARAIQTEIDEGRGIDGKDYVHLNISHLGKEKILKRLPQIRELAMSFAGIDPAEDPFPIQPTAHYSMGGIPTDTQGRVTIDDKGAILQGLYAAGECACVSVHGANRLGGNSLLETAVYGKIAGKSVAGFIRQGAKLESLPKEKVVATLDKVKWILKNNGEESVAEIREELQETMAQKCGNYRKKRRI